MRMFSLLLGAVLIAGLAGCSYQPARLSPEPAIVIDDDYRDHDRDHHHRGHDDHNRGDFCPPGQAKKGRC